MPRLSKKQRRAKPVALPSQFQQGFLSTLDGRTEFARALQQRFLCIATDLGGLDGMSEIKKTLVERFIWLEASLGKIESDLTETVDPKLHCELSARWTQGCNALLGIAKALGIDRKSQVAPWLEEIGS